jgi:hypothetical protein
VCQVRGVVSGVIESLARLPHSWGGIHIALITALQHYILQGVKTRFGDLCHWYRARSPYKHGGLGGVTYNPTEARDQGALGLGSFGAFPGHNSRQPRDAAVCIFLLNSPESIDSLRLNSGRAWATSRPNIDKIRALKILRETDRFDRKWMRCARSECRTWQHVAMQLEQAAGGGDIVSIALRMAMMVEKVDYEIRH